MKRIFGILVLSFLVILLPSTALNAQGRLLRRLKEEAEKKIEEEIFKGREADKSPTESDRDSRRSASNRRGGGLDAATPDVDLSIAIAETAFASKDFKGSRAALREALWGVELKMGKNLLEALPETVHSLKADRSLDRVSSSGEELTGLIIERVYTGRGDMELNFSVGNNSAFLSLSSIAVSSGIFQQRSEQEDAKQIQFQGHRGYIEYDDSSGYSLTVPFGQLSVMMLRGVNFESEREFVEAAHEFSLEMIKLKLGSQ